jgi:hypothetical protein
MWFPWTNETERYYENYSALFLDLSAYNLFYCLNTLRLHLHINSTKRRTLTALLFIVRIIFNLTNSLITILRIVLIQTLIKILRLIQLFNMNSILRIILFLFLRLLWNYLQYLESYILDVFKCNISLLYIDRIYLWPFSHFLSHKWSLTLKIVMLI